MGLRKAVDQHELGSLRIAKLVGGKPNAIRRGDELHGAHAKVAVACAAIVPLGVTVHSSAPLPSAVGRPTTSNGAVSNKGARARTVMVLIFRPGTESRSRSKRHCWANGPCTTSPG